VKIFNTKLDNKAPEERGSASCQREKNRREDRPDAASSRFSQCFAKTPTSLRNEYILFDKCVRQSWNSLENIKSGSVVLRYIRVGTNIEDYYRNLKCCIVNIVSNLTIS
jgi:hypothetical protein